MVRRHLDHPWRGVPHAPTVAAFSQVAEWVERDSRPLILDSGCGTGSSTREIARVWPDCLVIGIDRSEARLGRLAAPGLPWRDGNALWVRAELADFWRLAVAAGWKLERHYLLYPNPWPKAAHLRRRWHGHPGFTALLALGGCLELRTNWRIYAEEFALALGLATGGNVAVESQVTGPVTTPFERKYRARGDPLFRVVRDLP
ncbi:tRNA (guanine(46)-N(7))-methyltransferase TrmB [Elongatibacter sediminis]|uniref:tRNA (guanine(46)-N(7))-methyltransferase n=1 Tax=Elongatibacter sediminis TaxID=3119006 RepID=A0AAW9RI56_9GAMM